MSRDLTSNDCHSAVPNIVETIVRRIGVEYLANKETMIQSTVVLLFFISNSEHLNTNSSIAWYLFQSSYFLLKLGAVTLDSAQIDLTLFTLILAKIG